MTISDPTSEWLDQFFFVVLHRNLWTRCAWSTAGQAARSVTLFSPPKLSIGQFVRLKFVQMTRTRQFVALSSQNFNAVNKFFAGPFWAVSTSLSYSNILRALPVAFCSCLDGNL